MELKAILQGIARIFGMNEMTVEQAQAALDETLSFAELKAKAKSEVEDEFFKKTSALEAEKAALIVEKETLTTEVATLKARVTELEAMPAAEHTAGASDNIGTTTARAYESSPANIRAAELRAHQAKFNR